MMSEKAKNLPNMMIMDIKPIKDTYCLHLKNIYNHKFYDITSAFIKKY